MSEWKTDGNSLSLVVEYERQESELMNSCVNGPSQQRLKTPSDIGEAEKDIVTCPSLIRCGRTNRTTNSREPTSRSPIERMKRQSV